MSQYSLKTQFMYNQQPYKRMDILIQRQMKIEEFFILDTECRNWQNIIKNQSIGTQNHQKLKDSTNKILTYGVKLDCYKIESDQNYKYIYYLIERDMTFRSLDMSQFQIIIPKDSAYITINFLGYQDTLHITDSGDPSNRHFSQQIRRCQQNLQKIQMMKNALKKENMQFDEYEETQPQFVDKLKINWREQAKMLGTQEIKLIDVYQQKVAEQFSRYSELSNQVDKVFTNRKEVLQKIACLQTLSQFFGNTQPKRQTQQYYIHNVSQAIQIQSVSFLIGVINSKYQWQIAKMIYRVSRGYACTKTLDKFKFFGLKNFDKKVMLVIFPSSDSMVLERRLKRIMENFCQNVYSVNQFQFSAKQSYDTAVNQYNQISNLVEMGHRQLKEQLKKMKKMTHIQTWRIFFWKQKLLYETLNKLDRREQFYIANVYIPTNEIKRVSLLMNRIQPTPSMHEVPAEYPPTAFDTNCYTAPAQQIIDTYGVPRYKQINPTIFTTVTFPFFFGVMFGDVAHGAMIFALGVYMIVKRQVFEKSVLSVISPLRYMITMMGFFAIFCGFIYNDIAGFNMNLFSSCYSPPFHPGKDDTKIQIRLHPKPNCVYSFGIDPVWGRAQNQLVFVNSLKMKISVIIAIIHMTLGVFCKAANALYFRKKADFYFEFIPQLIFLVGLFGYMDFLIIFKWLKVWNEHVDNIPPQQWAPSIISTMMNVGLSLGKTSTIPDGNSNMWGQRGNSSQDTIQLIILLVAFLCIPIMLIPKPCIEIMKKKKVMKKKQSNPLEKELMEESKHSLQERLNPSDYQKYEKQSVLEEEDNSQIIVHQLIQTIEFVLGTISNTASYLRLWALSLAHSQLSKVFFQQTAGRFFGSEMYVEIPSLFVGSWIVMHITFGIIICMDSMECFLHSLRLHWVEFQNKFYKGDGYKYNPLSFRDQILRKKDSADS